MASEAGNEHGAVVDLQVNGAFGRDCGDGADAVREIAARLGAAGVAAFCPTLVTSGRAATERFLGSLPVAVRPGRLARVLGAHLEGPFLNPAAAGAHDPAHLRAVDLGEVEAWLAAGPPALVTIAPELPGAVAAIERLVAAGVVVALGHSRATFAEAAAGFDAGARLATHLFNAMAPFHHREPGLVGCALLRRDVVVGLIADGVHLHDAVVDVVVAAKGPAGVFLVSDAAAPAGMPPGTYRLGGREVRSDGLAIRGGGGELAGSCQLLPAVARRLVTRGYAAETVRQMTVATPAAVLAR